MGVARNVHPACTCPSHDPPLGSNQCHAVQCAGGAQPDGRLGRGAQHLTSLFLPIRLSFLTRAATNLHFLPLPHYATALFYMQVERNLTDAMGVARNTYLTCNCPPHHPIQLLDQQVPRRTHGFVAQVERNLTDAMGVARNICLDPRLVPGGGACEMAVSRGLSDRAAGVEGVEQWPYKAVGEWK